ncbi:MAG: MBOAT family O-acyltransferase, partial [Bacteroidota bacterium]
MLFPCLLVDFYSVRLIQHSSGWLRKGLFYTALLQAVMLLLIAKYFNFFIDNLNGFLLFWGGNALRFMEIALPIGISFVTFQRISYLMDCHSGKTRPLDQFADYALYILLFPQLIAGPIIRFNEIAAQILDRRAQENVDHRMQGLFQFIIGLSKKVLIANPLGWVVDGIFAMPFDDLNTGTAWLGIIAYSFQIYFDFSGYSDMAIGLGKMMGFRLPENFNFPYISQSISEFWRRWHITLGNWMRDYLYIPLGGNRVSKRRMYFNLWTVFLLSGLWHGAAWTFVIWGAFHGLFLILDRLFLLRFLQKIGPLPAIFLTYVISLIGWVFFRAADLESALA